MAGIIPLPTTRVSGMLIRQRLLAQMQGDQLDLFRLQNQVSTGQRFTLPSEDAPAARRAMTLQRLLERKTQLRSNIQTGQSFLKSTDVSLNNVAGLLGDIRGVALGVAGTTSTESERKAAMTEVNRAIEQLVSVGNTQFRGRYLFAGSQTNVQPYSYDGGYVTYHGDDQQISSYSDLGVLFSTSTTGLEVFGGISSEVLGGVDLNPEVSANTPLSALRGGRGISANGALQISDGTNTSIVDISRAATVGDVAKLIEANPPSGRRVTVDITGNGLTVRLEGAGNLTAKEVASGKAASELGIYNAVGAPGGKIVGTPLDPIITKTSPLHSMLGLKAVARLVSPGANNDIVLRAAANGSQYDGVTVQMVDDSLLRATPGVPAGSEYAVYRDTAHAAEASLRFSGVGNDLTVRATTPGADYNNVSIIVAGDTGIGNSPTAVYDPGTKQLFVTVDDNGSTTVDDVRNAINATGVFEAVPDESLEGVGAYNGAATIASSDINNVHGNTGNSGGAAKTLYVYMRPNASTANQVAAAINSEGTFTAELDTLDATNATQIGTRAVSVNATALSEGGSGETLDLASGIRVVSGNTTYTLTFGDAKTVEDVLNIINGSEAGLHAEINADGTSINVRSRLSGANLQIGENGGTTATQLGIRSYTGDTRLADMNHGVGVPTKRDSYQESPPAVVNDFTITIGSGAGAVNLDVDLSSAKTVQDVIDLINNRPENTPSAIVAARLNPTGNGIEITSVGGEPLTITAAEGSQAAQHLGLIPDGETSVTDAAGRIAGGDRNYLETPSVFTTLIRLKDALARNDTEAIERAISGIDADLERVTFARSEVGARQQALDVTENNLEDEDVHLRTALADEIEVDLVEAISNMTARQLSLEASLRVTSTILQTSLLNYL